MSARDASGHGECAGVEAGAFKAVGGLNEKIRIAALIERTCPALFHLQVPPDSGAEHDTPPAEE
jgi:hypothetical protein